MAQYFSSAETKKEMLTQNPIPCKHLFQEIKGNQDDFQKELRDRVKAKLTPSCGCDW